MSYLHVLVVVGPVRKVVRADSATIRSFAKMLGNVRKDGRESLRRNLPSMSSDVSSQAVIKPELLSACCAFIWSDLEIVN